MSVEGRRDLEVRAVPQPTEGGRTAARAEIQLVRVGEAPGGQQPAGFWCQGLGQAGFLRRVDSKGPGAGTGWEGLAGKAWVSLEWVVGLSLECGPERKPLPIVGAARGSLPPPRPYPP